ncbi:PhoH family protein [Zhenpiania hominis]|uniref:PhoH-like protein n=1 Tax=Zhenpiania hominis TaxID=2763644 RepID=A0A923NKA3_9FIRM|nr:PhoH family protein [Zhenpiania hominis]MBC6678604.1 PhoH family protein [Zhenpiania hominis]
MINNETENIRKIAIDETIDRGELFGTLDSNVRILKENLDVDIMQRDNELILRGKDAKRAEAIFQELMEIISSGEKLDEQKINYVIALKDEGLSYEESKVNKDIICFTHKGKPLRPKTLGQRKYVQSIRKRDIVFGIGPAGTGKTYIAVAMAVHAFKNKEVQKIILTRPAVEAGERLGFLPGDMQEKVDPYLRPLYDALYDVLGRESALRLKEKEAIEVVPLAYMRGRTLDNSFIILDEAQNTTREQMKMFLTRMGFGSKIVVTGDVTQVDLPRGKKSGLLEAAKILKNVKGIDFCYLKDVDVVRHELVKKIIGAYDKYYQAHPYEEDKE